MFRIYFYILDIVLHGVGEGEALCVVACFFSSIFWHFLDILYVADMFVHFRYCSGGEALCFSPLGGEALCVVACWGGSSVLPQTQAP